MKEIWKQVVGYEGCYEVSNTGKVKSLHRNIIIKPGVCGSKGYHQLTLNKNAKKKRMYIHRLVAQAFLDLSDSTNVDHKDGNPLNNNVSNLRLCTKSQNQFNRTTQRNNKSGKVGVIWVERHKRWMAYISKDGKQIYLGNHKRKTDAIAARVKAEKRIAGEFLPQKKVR